MDATTTQLLELVFHEFDNVERFAGVMLAGSGARGVLSVYSDIDLIFVAYDEPEDEREAYQLIYRQRRLVSISVRSFHSCQKAFENPESAVKYVQGMRDAVLLRDSDAGDLALLKNWAKSFNWTPDIQAAAYREASFRLRGYAEELHKILKGFATNDEFCLLNGAWGIALAMPFVLALKHGVLSRGDNEFYGQVREAVGLNSAWTKYHAIAMGTAEGPPEFSRLGQQAVGAAWLYEESAKVCNDILTAEDREVIELAIHNASDSGLLPEKHF